MQHWPLVPTNGREKIMIAFKQIPQSVKQIVPLQFDAIGWCSV